MGSSEAQAMAAHGYRPAMVGGRYRVTGVLAEAEDGDVVTGVDVREDREVVLKRVRKPSRTQTTRIRTVHAILSGLKHRNVMRALDLKEGNADAWLVSGEVSGRDLLDWWSRLPLGVNASFDERWGYASPLVGGLLDGLGAMHRSQLAHLDLKPSNIRVDRLGIATVVDFGFGAGLGDEEPDADDEAGLDDWFGYQAPELLDGLSVSSAADQWSLGAVIYVLLTGKRPVPGRTLAELQSAYERGRVQPITDWRPDVPEEVATIVTRMLAWEPMDRFPSISDVRDAFGKLLHSPPKQPYQPWSAPHPTLVGREPFLTFFHRRMTELVRGGKGALVRLSAPAGAGKTRLLEAWASEARDNEEVDAFFASCRPGVARTALDGWFRPPAVDLEASPPKDLVEQAVAAIRRPTVLLLDHLEEVDAVTWARIHRVAAAAASGTSPLLVVLSGRALPDLEPRVTPESPRFFNVELPPLTPRAVEKLLRAASAEEDDLAVRDRAAEAFCDEADGLPANLVRVFLEDEEQGRVLREGRHWVVQVGAGIEEPPVRARPTMHEQFLAWVEELGGTVEVEALLCCLAMRRTAVVDGLRFAADSDEVSFRYVAGRWYVTVAEGVVSSAVEVYGKPEAHRRFARWLEAAGDAEGLAAERTGQHWHKGGDSAAAAGCFAAASAAEATIGNTSDARRLLMISRTLAARASGNRR
ncbi:MAG: protein kinase [Proteobacteria bacterium]|nr:protein kinase [Pseudomonadota bacterium]